MKLNPATTCACQHDDPYLCWAKRYLLNCDATSTIREAVTSDGGPCLCRCHDEDEWADELTNPCLPSACRQTGAGRPTQLHNLNNRRNQHHET